MILIAFVLVSVLSLVVIAATRNHRQMNTVCIAQAAIFAAIAVYIALFQQVPVVSFLVGSPDFFLDHLGLFEILIATVIFACAAVYARGYVEGLLECGELEKGSLKLFYAAWVLLLQIIVLAFMSDNLALFWIFAELTTIISAMLIAILSPARTSMPRSNTSSWHRSPCSLRSSGSSSSSRSRGSISAPAP